ncbi:hypothetical protein N7462_002630 [Penicillium macrosclerotiorum]|uniref:uncharacterized protein n=1 Tax=Penicillium macrosclerotiorum TaxID=303699 RepID=UPI0025496370|nr:uncharacterized protein N7462_002630 [Penicillium macrosclerotiorum]KAJ5693207.1 hypothetical protein N7462_002630 [Penicillium macrosclerotiorum]
MHTFIFLTTVLLSTSILSSAVAIPQFLKAQSTPSNNSTIAARASQLPFGAVITHCTVPGTIALTFDDGPYIYTSQMLDNLAAHNARATFFLNGVNRGHIDAFPDLVRRSFAEGHQLGSHTWGHPNLIGLDSPTITAQMMLLEDAFLRILGFFPTYMRAPFLFVDGTVLAVMAQLKYHVIGASVDTKDYENDHPDWSWRSFEKFRRELDSGGNIVLAHDSHENTVAILVDNMLDEVEARGLSTVTVGECLGDPPEFWYRTDR